MINQKPEETPLSVQWSMLVGTLTGRQKTADLDNQFFQRLLTVSNDENAGPADIAVALRDAVATARAADIDRLQIPLSALPVLTVEACEKAGIELDLYRESTSGVAVDADSRRDTWAGVQRRFLKTPAMDAPLIQALGGRYSHYQGDGQQAAVRQVLTAPDDATLLVNLPTGCGKTMVIDALLACPVRNGLTLVIVPTVALALEQAQRAKDLLVRLGQDPEGATAWVGGLAVEQRKQIRQRMNIGEQKVLFCSPELVTRGLLPQLFRVAETGLLTSIVIDEAHLIESWGMDFRPAFQRLVPLCEALAEHASKGVRRILMSATFSESCFDLLTRLFKPSTGEIIRIHGNFLRPEPSYQATRVADGDDYQQQVMAQVWQLPRPLILYVQKPEDAEAWKSHLKNAGFSRLAAFHGDTANDQRKQLIKAWRDNQLDIMIATSAFGVGMDKNDVRSVLHACIPESLDRFYQESGRGGRDGRACLSRLLWQPGMLSEARRKASGKTIGIKKARNRWENMRHHAQQAGDGGLRFPLDSLSETVTRTSDRNAAWNWKTLQLLHRSGMIRLHIKAPQLPEESIQWTEEERDRFYDDYYGHIDIELLAGDMARDAAWLRLEEHRRAEKLALLKGFDALQTWLKTPDSHLCRALQRFYTLEGFTPESACGGCPGCRQPFTPTLGYPPSICGAGQEGASSVAPVQAVYYSDHFSNEKKQLRDWNDWISRLLNSGRVGAIRAEPRVLEKLAESLKDKVRHFWVSLTPDCPAGDWTELCLLLEKDQQLPDLFSPKHPVIVVAPEHLGDPNHPARRWWECEANSQALNTFIQRLHHVDYQ